MDALRARKRSDILPVLSDRMTGLPFGYVLVHKDIYDVMLAALAGRGIVASPAPEPAAPAQSARAAIAQAAPDAVSAPAATLSPSILTACEVYGFGDPQEVNLNRRQATAWAGLGWTEAEIVAGIRDGGQPALVG